MRTKMVLTSKSLISLVAVITIISNGMAATSVAIYSTVVSSSKNQLTIAGSNFSPSGLAPTVVSTIPNSRLLLHKPEGCGAVT